MPWTLESILSHPLSIEYRLKQRAGDGEKRRRRNCKESENEEKEGPKV